MKYIIKRSINYPGVGKDLPHLMICFCSKEQAENLLSLLNEKYEDLFELSWE